MATRKNREYGGGLYPTLESIIESGRTLSWYSEVYYAYGSDSVINNLTIYNQLQCKSVVYIRGVYAEIYHEIRNDSNELVWSTCNASAIYGGQNYVSYKRMHTVLQVNSRCPSSQRFLRIGGYSDYDNIGKNTYILQPQRYTIIDQLCAANHIMYVGTWLEPNTVNTTITSYTHEVYHRVCIDFALLDY